MPPATTAWSPRASRAGTLRCVHSHEGGTGPAPVGGHSPQTSAATVPQPPCSVEPAAAQDVPRDACGVFGVWAPGEDVSKLTYYALYALQHRGQEAAGMAVADASTILVYKDLGLVAQVFDEATLGSLRGHLGGRSHALLHDRVLHLGERAADLSRPALRRGRGTGPQRQPDQHLGACALQPDVSRRAQFVGATSDSDVITRLLAADDDLSLEEAARRVLPRLVGAFSLVFCDETTLYAARDGHGLRPLCLGRLERGWVVASETAALDIVGAAFVREIEPGELVVIDSEGVRSHRFAAATPHLCLFEYVYLARPDTTIAGRSVHATRVALGRALAREAPAQADLVIPVPQSGGPAAIGYAEASGIPYGEGLVKNAYVGRTFIQPSQTIRQLGIRLKLNPLRDVIRGKRLVVVDDSIVRGNTQRALVRMLREAGATEVHVRISSPPVRWPCYYGIDFATRAELIANGLSVAEICASLGADSLGYVSLDGLVAASRQAPGKLCRACFDGVYPVPLPERELLGKDILERLGREISSEVPTAGALDALTHCTA